MAERSAGGIWVKNGPRGDFFSITIEIDGEKKRFVAFKNDYKKEGDSKPDYTIKVSKPRDEDAF